MTSPTSTSHQQGLPSISSLTNGLPPSNSAQQYAHGDQAQGEHLRDSDNSLNSQGLHVRTLLNPDDSPPRSSVPNTPQSARIPTSAHSGGSQLPSINQGFHDSAHRGSTDYATQDSRRSSVDSRMHTGFNNLYINNPHSPYESTNNSAVSLAASLRRPNGGAPMSPLSGRSSLRGHPPSRVAPQIMPVARGPGAPDPTAAKPTQGFAWAFPDGPIPEERRGSDSGESSIGVSRTNSIAASSIRSSIFSTDSQMPHGQRRLEDDPTTHHHTMQHRAVQNLQNESAAAGIGNYSRTPELRVSHKLAERKRRSEMKDLFEDLNKAVPTSGGTKASKWEILSKAIDYIRALQVAANHDQERLQRVQRDADYAHEAHKENEMLKNELRIMQTNLQRLDPNTSHVYGPYSQQLSQQGAAPAPSGSVSLPPISHGAPQGPPPPPSYGNGVQSQPHPAQMQGVEYGGYGR